MNVLRYPNRASSISSRPNASGRQTCVVARASTAPAANAPRKSEADSKAEESLHFKLVKEALKKEHEHHGQGKVMFVHMEGRGRRQTVGWDLEHVGNLSGEPVRSVDYSMYG